MRTNIIFLLLARADSTTKPPAREILEKGVDRRNFLEDSFQVQIQKVRAGITKKITLNLSQRNYPEMSATFSSDGAKILTWVNQGTFAGEKIQAFDQAGKLIRKFNLRQEKKIGENWQELAEVYQDFQKGQKVTFQITHARFNTSLKDELFLSQAK